MSHADIIKGHLMSSIDELAANREKYIVDPDRNFTRNRKLHMKPLIQMNLTLGGDDIQEELYGFFGRSEETATATAYYKQMSKTNNCLMPDLFHTFNSKISKSLYRGKYQILAIDGSSLDIPHNSKQIDTYFPPDGKSKKGYNQVHIVASYSINDHRYTDLIIQPGRKRNEYDACCQLIDRMGSDGPTAIIMGDRGFASYNTYAHAYNSGHYFMFRITDKRLEGILGHSLDNVREMDGWHDVILSRSQAKKKRLQPDREDRYRHICSSVKFDYLDEEHPEYEMSLRVVRFQLSTGGYENIITNLPDVEFDIEEIEALYHLRWDIETSFRYLKYTLCLKALHSKKYDYIIREIWARAILHNCSAAIIHAVGVDDLEEKQKGHPVTFSEEYRHIKKKKAQTVISRRVRNISFQELSMTCRSRSGRKTKHEYKVNFTAAFKTCREFLRIHDGVTQMEVRELIRKHVVPIRSDRSYERRLRVRQPFQFCYR